MLLLLIVSFSSLPCVFFIDLPPARSTRTATLFPYTTLFRSRVARLMVAQDEAFEEPADMRQVPFGGGRVGHGLDRRIRVRRRRGERFAQSPDLAIAGDEVDLARCCPASCHA